jgi:hypothetical protein
MRRRVTYIVLAVVLLAVAGVAWYLQSTMNSPGGLAAQGDRLAGITSPPGYKVTVVENGRTLASYTLAGLEAIGVKHVVVQGQPQDGPTLLSVLAKTGVKHFTAVDVVGEGVRDSGKMTLTRAQVVPDVVLAVAQRGTVKIAGPDIPQDQRIRDVIRLVVK